MLTVLSCHVRKDQVTDWDRSTSAWTVLSVRPRSSVTNASDDYLEVLRKEMISAVSHNVIMTGTVMVVGPNENHCQNYTEVLTSEGRK